MSDHDDDLDSTSVSETTVNPQSRDPDPRRQANHIISAFRFQLLETAIAWLELGQADTLLIEVFEDFDVQSGTGDTQLTQVKHSASDRRLTLASKDSRDALRNYWKTSRAGLAPGVSLLVHTNMQIGQERGGKLPDGAAGIQYWQEVREGADAGPLKTTLLSVLPEGELRTWLATGPDDDTIKSRLIDRVTWKTAQAAGSSQKALLTELIAGRLAALELPVGLAPTCAASIIDRVDIIASDTDASLRKLRVEDLHAFLNEVARSGQHGHEVTWSMSSWTVSAEEIDLPAYIAPREHLVGELANTLTRTHALWLHGASGTGKSTLAQQVAAMDGRRWLVAEFRGQDQATETLLRLDRAYTDIALGSEVGGVILDDVDVDVLAQHPRRFARFISWMNARGGAVMFTCARTVSPTVLQSLGLEPSAVSNSPYLTVEDVIGVIKNTDAPADIADAWGLFIHTATSGGHPQLVAAKIVSLEHRDWPKEALTEDLSGQVSEAVELTRTEARRRLLNDATAEGRAFLKRLGCILFKFDRATAIASATIEPEIKEPAASLDLLTGPWIEPVPSAPGFMRLSPLLTGLHEDLGEKTIKDVRVGMLVSTIQRGPIPYEALDSLFWTAYSAKQGWFFVKFFESSLSFDEDKSEAIAAKLGPIVYLTTEEPLFPEEPGTSHLLRLMQVDIAAQNGEKTLFQPIAIAAVREARLQDSKELQDAFTLMALFKILFSHGTTLDWGLRLTWISLFEALADREPDLMARSQSGAVQAMKAEFGEVTDVGGFMLIIGAQAVESPTELKALLVALDALEPALRTRRLAQLKAFFKGYGLHVQSAWVRVWSAGTLNADNAIVEFNNMASLAASWGDDDLVAECIVAQSVIWDEFQDDRVAALNVVDAALTAMPEHAELLRQKAKVFGHDGQYGKARLILETIRPAIDERSNIERMYAIKEQAVATAASGDYEKTRNLFCEAAAAAEDVSGEVDSVHAHGLALRAEAAMCAWRVGDHETALRELASIVDSLAGIDPEVDKASRMLHAKIRWLVGWLFETSGTPASEPPRLEPGAIAALDAEPPEDDLQVGARHEDIKLLLAVVALRFDVHDVFKTLDWASTTPGFHIFLKAGEFDLAVESGDPKTAALAALNLTASFVIARRNDAEDKNEAANLPIENAGGLCAADLTDEMAGPIFLHAIALAVFMTEGNQANAKAYCAELFSEVEKRLGDKPPLINRLFDLYSGVSDPVVGDHAELVLTNALRVETDVLYPAEAINQHLALLQCAVLCGCGPRMVQRLFTKISNQWSFVLERQRFLLTNPALHAPELELAIEDLRQQKPGSLAQLLETAGRALNSEIPSVWLQVAEKLGGRANGKA